MSVLEMNQSLITNKGGAQLLSNASTKTDDVQTLRMIAGAIANLCGNGKLEMIIFRYIGKFRVSLGLFFHFPSLTYFLIFGIICSVSLLPSFS